MWSTITILYVDPKATKSNQIKEKDLYVIAEKC
jgi:hypothetical protein